MSLQLPGGITLESLYQISDQSIWFLIWILKKIGFWSYLTKEALEAPFTVERIYWPNRQIRHFLRTKKNTRPHGIDRSWYENGQLYWEQHWKDGKKDGTSRRWNENGQLISKTYWKNGQFISEKLLDSWYRIT